MTDRFALSSALRFSSINPQHVRAITACYRAGDNEDYRVGFIAQMPHDYPMGEYVYIVLKVEWSIRRETVSTQYFDKFPAHLLDRSEDWITDGATLDRINESLGYSKAHAKHGSSTSAFDPTPTGSMVWVRS